MNLIENFKMALDSIRSNKLRSFLTMLGIIIGISSVITILSLGAGGKQSILGELEKIGAATVQVKVNSLTPKKEDKLTLKDVSAIKEKSNNVKYATGVVNKQGVAKSEKGNKRAVVYGANADIYYIRNAEVLYGRYFNEKEVEETKNVAVIDEGAAKYFFGYADAVGETLMVGKGSSLKKVTIVGVTKLAGYMMGMSPEGMPAMIYMPATTVNSIFDGDGTLDEMNIMADSKDKAEVAASDALNILKGRHNNREENIYSAENLIKQVDQFNKVIDIFTSFIGAVAAISLLVGGIGVMNIMLVSVTERTREIGIRKAIGATTNVVLIQFLTESVIISLIGGVMGMIIGIAGAFGIGSFAGVTPILSFNHIILVILFSSGVGIFFGIYPARKAAKLDPIDALRYE